MNNRFKFFSDTATLSLMIAYVILVGGEGLVLTICFIIDRFDGWLTSVIMINTIMIVMWIAILLSAHRWAAMIYMDNEGISYKPFLRKSNNKKYDEMPYLTKAWYNSNRYSDSEKYRKYFIVLSDEPLKDYHRSCITCLKQSENLLKIEFSKKNYDALLSILPESHRTQLESQFSDMIE